MKWFCTAALLLVILPAQAQPLSQRAIEAALKDSAAGWSAGDLDRFMAVYEHTPDVTYIGATGLVRGYDAIRAQYQARFAAAPGGLGTLSLNVLDFRPLGTGYALVTGRFTLHRASGDASGLFTLAFHFSADGWHIISDHSS